jgi:hypothetical protein
VKRIISACLEQTFDFERDDEFKTFFSRYDRRGTKYKIVGKETTPDKHVVVRIVKEYNTYPIGDYLN